MTNDIHLDIDVEGAAGTGTALKRGFSDGLKDAGEYLLKKGEEHAIDYITGTDRVWLKRVKRGFSTQEPEFPRSYHWKGYITNSAPHAKIVDDGLAPQGKHGPASPEAQDIIAWVDSEVVPNAIAQEKAQKSNIENWEPEVRAMAESHGTATTIAAFAIAEHIKKEGYPGINFTGETEGYIRGLGTMIVRNKIEKHLRKQLRKNDTI